MSCGEFLGAFAEAAGGRVLGPTARDECGYCPLGPTDDLLARSEPSCDARWGDSGLFWAHILLTTYMAAAPGLYWGLRVPEGKGTKHKGQMDMTSRI